MDIRTLIRNVKSGMAILPLKEHPVLIHTSIGIAVGYFLLHPITMVIYWFQNNDNILTLQSVTDAFSKALIHAFYLHMMPMSIAFIIIGGIIGLFSGISFRKIRKQGREIRMQQYQLNESLEKLENLNESLEEKVVERTIQLKESNENMEVLNLKLLDLDKAKAGFLNLISHEIRTPLNGIIGPLELLKRSVHARDISDLVEILNTSVIRLEKFALNALLITRLKTKQIEIKKDKIYLSNLISEVLDEEKESFLSGNIQVKKNDELNQVLISGEADLIKKCIGNILDNAITSSPNDSTIEINMYSEDNSVICEIKDSGKGFPPGAIDQVFELFNDMDGEYKDNRIGVGLSIVKMIMEAHGGRITIGNNPDCGASVKLLFMKNIKKIVDEG
jgi:signal transduction histidine kinase